MATIRETCPCGSVWEGPDTHTPTLNNWRAAHEVCREKGVAPETKERLELLRDHLHRQFDELAVPREVEDQILTIPGRMNILVDSYRLSIRALSKREPEAGGEEAAEAPTTTLIYPTCSCGHDYEAHADLGGCSACRCDAYSPHDVEDSIDPAVVQPYPLCRCGHRYDHHRHHAPERCYRRGCSCSGYAPEGEDRA